MEFEADSRGYDNESRGYDRDRSRSPRNDRSAENGGMARSASPSSHSRGAPPDNREQEDENARNPGTNLFVTGIHPRLSEEDVSRLFEKYGDVEKCNIMRDPHTRESRGFGFVKMVLPEQADAAKDGLQGEVIDGRTLSIEKARRARPRTPTPGKYYGPPKREDRRPRGGGRYGDRYNDRRGGFDRRDDWGYRGGGGGGGGGGSRYGDRYEDRGFYGRRDREEYPRNIDRYASSREDRFERRGGGGGGGYYEREDNRSGGYGDRGDREGYGGRSYEDREDRYSRR